MADRAASAVSINLKTGPVLKLKVTQFEIDPEIRTRRSVTSDVPDANGYLGPTTVFESAGGIIRGTGYVDPADTLVALILSSFASNYDGTQYNFANTQIVLDRFKEAGGAQYGYVVGTGKLFPVLIKGQTDDAGMIEVQFEIHAPGGLSWSSTLTAG